MNNKKIIQSGKYDLHTIDDVILEHNKEYNYLDAGIFARENNNKYIKRFPLSIRPEEQEGQNFLEFLTNNGETELSVEEIKNRIMESNYFELNIDKARNGKKIKGINFTRGGLLNLSSDFALSGLYRKNKSFEIRLMEATEYLPIKPFQSFREEKEFRRYYGRNRVWAWGDSINAIENDIKEIISTLNKLDFAYANGWSHSGTPKDHDGPGSEYERENFKLDCLKENHTGIPNSEHSGYFIFKVDEKNPNYKKFEKEIQALPNVEINDMKDKYKNKILLVKVDDEIIKKGNIPAYQKHLESKWDEVISVMKGYLE